MGTFSYNSRKGIANFGDRKFSSSIFNYLQRDVMGKMKNIEKKLKI